MFTGQAEVAMTFYTSLFPDGRILSLTRYGAGEAGREGTVVQARFALNGQTFMCIDSPPMHAFGFTPSFSIFITCETRDDVDRLFTALSEGGAVLMPLDAYPFSERYGWLTDRFGVSWQVGLGQ
jgi:predicted 3-demethylubiquinone-9 3-methyltransferase (glyoxalase superfamily)